MDKGQLNLMKLFGYVIEELPGKVIPKMTYYKVGSEGVIELPGLPADPYHMQRYLKRGFLLKKPEEPPLAKPQKGESTGFPCETCGKVLSTRLALAGHSRSHKK